MKRTSSEIILLILSLFTGSIIAVNDTSPHWNDTGITAFLVLISALLFSLYKPQRVWLFAFLCGAPVPVLNILASHNYGSLGALLFAFAGAGIGMLIRKNAING